MKIFALFILLFTQVIAFGQTETYNNSELVDLFEEINKTDASHLKEPAKRRAIFVQNYNTIIAVIKNQGLPKLEDPALKKKDLTSISQGTYITFVHILQTRPELLLNETSILLIKEQLDKKRIAPVLLKNVLKVFQFDIDNGNIKTWTKEVENAFYFAIKSWDIKLYDEQ